MSAWRRIAIEKLPQHRELIERSESVGMLWVDLRIIFERAHHEPKDVSTIRAIYEFARWCVADSHSADISTSAVCHFYEHLPQEPLVRHELPKHMTRPEFLGMVEAFKYHLSPEEHEAFVREFLEQRERVIRSAI